MTIRPLLPLVIAWLLATPALGPARAAVSEGHATEALTATLLTAEDGVSPDATTVSAGLRLALNGGWKAYWRTPGEVGMAPQIDWSSSGNVADVRTFWPAPSRFRAFGIENYGYKGEVVLPLEVKLERPGEPASLNASVSLLVCDTVCIPEAFALSLELPAGDGIDRDAAARIAEHAARVPAAEGARVTRAALTGDALVLELESDRPLAAPDVFPEFADGAFGAPDIRVAEDGRTLWASLPVVSAPGGEATGVTVTDAGWAATMPLPLSDAAPEPPFEIVPEGNATRLVAMIGLALLGGLILNVMPCVLPVLAIKLAGAIRLGGERPGAVRAGFLASAAGVMAFMAVLAVGVLALRAAGGAVGWGVQFQSPAFLAAIVVVLLLFAANIAGLFEIALPASWQTRMAKASGGDVGAGGTSLVPDFLTGAFAALLATPCSAPFLGTAVAFALGGGTVDVVAIFTALGFGLAAPYLLVAARPSLVRRLPRPGPWMEGVKWLLGGALLATALWLTWVLAGVAGTGAALATLVLGGLAAAVPALAGGARVVGTSALLALGALAVVVPTTLGRPPAPAIAGLDERAWVPFDRAAIPRRVAAGEVVFVDVTADWCLTCKVNKRVVLSAAAVEAQLGAITAMRADWTRPDDAILAYLKANGRYGIPFNAVYGPGAPEGIVLSELLTQDAVLAAIARARGT